MKKDKITIQKKDEMLHFYLVSEEGRLYLFSQKFSRGVYEYFKNDKSERQIKEFKSWGKNPRLNKTIEKIPLYTKYVRQEIA